MIQSFEKIFQILFVELILIQLLYKHDIYFLQVTYSETYTMSLSQSAQMFCPGGRLDCGVVGRGFVSGAETGLSPARAGDEGVATPLGM